MPLYSFPNYRHPGVRGQIYWTGAVSNNWNTTEANWAFTSDHTPTTFQDGDRVLISPSTNATILINAANVAPAVVDIVTRGTLGLGGSYGIVGSGSLWMRNDSATTGSAGAITLATTNTHTGGTHIGRTSELGLYVYGGSHISSWTTGYVIMGIATCLGTAGTNVDVGGPPSGYGAVGTSLFKSGYSTTYGFTITQDATVYP